MRLRTWIFAAAFAPAALGSTPVLAAVTTEIYVTDIPFLTGGSLTGSFGLSWTVGPPATVTSTPVDNNPFSFTTTPGDAQDGSTALTGFTYTDSNAAINLSGSGDTIRVTNPAGAGQGSTRENVLYITFEDPLIDLVDGTITSDPIVNVTIPGGSGTPMSGECENPSFAGGGDFCSATTRRILGEGSARLVIPEPSTWLMMLSGFAALGLVGARRRSARPA